MIRFYLKYITIALLLAAVAACSKDSVEPEASNTEMDIPYKGFGEPQEVEIPTSIAATFTPRAFAVKGDTMFVANTNAADRAIYIVDLSTNALIGKLSSWRQDDTDKAFTSDITDIAVNDKLIFVGVQTSNVFIFDRATLKLVNVIGNAAGNWGNGVYDMVHCYGLCVSGQKLILRDKESIRAYWIYEAITEPSSKIPWIGKVTNGDLGYDYNPTLHGTVEYRNRVYLTDWYSKSIQVVSPDNFKIVFGESTNTQVDTVLRFEKLQPLGVTVSGGKLLVSSQKSPNILRVHPLSGQIVDTIATFSNRNVGRMQLHNGKLYFVDLKGNKIESADAKLN